MPNPIVHCKSCGFVFESRAFSISNAIDVSFVGVTETCPRCGQDAAVLEGEFDFIGDTTFVRKAPKETIDLLSALQRALLSAREGKAKDQIVKELETVSSEAAEAVSTAYSKGGIGLLVLVLMMLINQCTANFDIKLDINRLVDQFMQQNDRPIGGPSVPGKDTQPEAQPERQQNPKETLEALSRQQRRKQERQAAKRQSRNDRR